MWGPDAMEFRPERWLESSNEKTETPLGMYANLYVLRLLDKPRLTYFRYTKAHFLRGGKGVYRLEVRVSHRLQIQWDVAETHSTPSKQPRGDPGVLGDPHPRIQLLDTGGEESANGPPWDPGPYGRRGGR